jgi:hypothetical protein
MSSIVDTYVASPVSSTPAIRVGDVLGHSWRLYLSGFKTFSLLALVAYAPQFIFTLLAPRTPVFLGLGYILGVICSSLANAAIIYGVIQGLRGRSFTFAESMRVGLGRLGPIVALSLIITLLSALGLVLLIVPGFIIMTMYAVALSICVAERAGVVASMRRSAYLTKGNRWRIFGIQLLIIALLAIGGMVIGLVIGFGVGFGAASASAPLIQSLARYPIQVTAGAFNAVAGGVLYYKLRAVKEGVDIEKIAAVFD